MSKRIYISFAFVATHNHFVLDRGDKVFKQSAPIIKLPQDATEEEHLALIGLLNSSTSCFWMKQTFHNKGDSTDTAGARVSGEPEFDTYEFTGTGLKNFPVPENRPFALSNKIDQLAQQRQKLLPAQLAGRFPMTMEELDSKHKEADNLLYQMISIQEELDWECYNLYGIFEDNLTFRGSLPSIRPGERTFEILLAQRILSGETESTWFSRHRFTPINDIPDVWPEDYKLLIKRQFKAISMNRNIRLLEKPDFKRRWNLEPWEKQEERTLREWLLDRVEAMPIWKTDAPELTTCARLADQLHHDSDFLQVAELYRGRSDFDLTELVTELVQGESVPFLPVIRYKPSGLRKRAAWERTWELQRKEDAGEQVGNIPVPPKYTATDLKNSVWWKHRGKLDVPKERFIIYSHCEKASDPTPVIAWAGWNHLQQAQALAGYLISMKENEGWSVERLIPLLAGLLELLPWLKQWHNELDPTFGTGMGDYFEGFIDEQMRSLELTTEMIQSWQPPQKTTKRRTRRKKTE